MSSLPVVLITGANKGLGFETVRALFRASKPYHVLVCGRSIANAKEAIEKVKKEYFNSKSDASPIQLDIENDKEIASVAEQIEKNIGRLDVLVNNAGAQFDALVGDQLTERDMWNKTWNVNVTSTWLVTQAFMPLLFKSESPRVIFITSGTSSVAETENEGLMVNKSPDAGWPKGKIFQVPAYRSAKTGLNMMYREFYRILGNDKIKVLTVSPGWLATDLGGVGKEKMKQMGAIEPEKGGELVASVVHGDRDGDEGKVVRADDTQPW